MINVSIKRTEKETIVTAKTEVISEKAFKFESLSPTITQSHLRIILPMMIDHERDNRIKKAHRREELKAIKAEKLVRSEKHRAQIDETSEV